MGYDCDECGSSFASRYNLERHRDRKHPDEDKESMVASDDDDKESMVTDSDAEEEERTQDKTESESESENEGGDEEDQATDEENEEFHPQIINDTSNKAWERYASKFEDLVEEYTVEGKDEADAKQAAYNVILPLYRKAFREEYTDMLLRIRELKKDPTHKAVMESAKRFRDDDDYTFKESLRAAVTKRKHLINELLDEKYHDEFPENE
jgi:hypothetical protein